MPPDPLAQLWINIIGLTTRLVCIYLCWLLDFFIKTLINVDDLFQLVETEVTLTVETEVKLTYRV